MTIEIQLVDDERLRDALAKAAPHGGVNAALERLRGVAAAPSNFNPKAQRGLIASSPDHALADLLDDRLEQLSADYDQAIRPGDRECAEQRLNALRAALKDLGLTGFMVPRVDEHLGEYVARNRQRLAWLTGFTGSAGAAVVLTDKAALFVDGRYTIQARTETSDTLYNQLNSSDTPASKWLQRNLSQVDRLGYDPWLHTPDGVKKLQAAAQHAGAELIPVETNPLDGIWLDQPPPPLGPVIVHEHKYAGETSVEKRTRLGNALAQSGANAAILTAPDSIAWLLNIRGGDLPHTPVALGFAILHRNATVDLFMDQHKFTDGVTEHLGNQVHVREPDEFASVLNELGQAGSCVQLDPAASVAWLSERLKAAGATIAPGADPCARPKATKNQTEIAGIRACHIRDGAALTRFISWVTATAPRGGVDELMAARELGRLRAEVTDFRDLSFRTISAAGPNAALPHYTVNEQSNRMLELGTIYLVDSGCQYPDGTTDVTRTVAIGTPTAEHRDRFTRVLKGHIALGTARFPKGTSGSQLDGFARRPLWDAGLDFDHGTGHGVGAYLSVHEGPHRISKMPNNVALEPGMVVSNEPGYYKVGGYGIRIENLVEVVAADPKQDDSLLAFRNLTCAPIDLQLVERSLLSEAEIVWLNDYHVWVREELTPLLDSKTAAWLEAGTTAI